MSMSLLFLLHGGTVRTLATCAPTYSSSVAENDDDDNEGDDAEDVSALEIRLSLAMRFPLFAMRQGLALADLQQANPFCFFPVKQ